MFTYKVKVSEKCSFRGNLLCLLHHPSSNEICIVKFVRKAIHLKSCYRNNNDIKVAIKVSNEMIGLRKVV